MKKNHNKNKWFLNGGRRSGDRYISTVLSMPISLEEKKILIQKYTNAVRESICMQLDFYMAMAGGNKNELQRTEKSL